MNERSKPTTGGSYHPHYGSLDDPNYTFSSLTARSSYHLHSFSTDKDAASTMSKANSSITDILTAIISSFSSNPSSTISTPILSTERLGATIVIVIKAVFAIVFLTLCSLYLSSHTNSWFTSDLSVTSTMSFPPEPPSLTVITPINTTDDDQSTPLSPGILPTSQQPTLTLSFASLQPTVTLFTPGYEVLPAVSYLPWDVVAEPFKAQNLSVSLSIVSEDSTSTPITLSSLAEYGIEVVWTVQDNQHVGESVLFTENRGVGVYDCTITLREKPVNSATRNPHAMKILKALLIPSTMSNQKTLKTFKSSHTDNKASDYAWIDSDDVPTDISYTFTMAVKYIRRELRSLSDIDRDNILTAMRKLYSDDTVSTSAKYMSMERFLYYHLQGAGTSDCDHWHDGAGIVTHHSIISLALEQSLQTIDPSIALPYWEYPRDSLVYSNSSYTESEIFYPNWFGSASPTSDDHSLSADSRFGGILTPNGTKYAKGWERERSLPNARQNVRASLNPFTNPYGYMRSPWNMNTSPYFGRRNLTYDIGMFTTLPTCSIMKDCYDSESLAELFKCLNGKTHGSVHIMIGGAWTNSEWVSDYPFQHNALRVLLFKVLWRTGITRCPATCNSEESSESCRCRIPDELFVKYSPDELVDKALLRVTFESVFDDYGYDFNTLSSDEIKWLLRSLEHVDTAGEMFTSAASWDPLFLPLHGSIERLLGYKRMNIDLDKDTTFDTTWGYPEYDPSRGVYLDAYCDWANVDLDDVTSLPDCGDAITCPGHYEDDLLEFGNFLNDNETYTNAEFYEFIHPWNDYLPYVYDTYHFDYCHEDGVYFIDDSDSNVVVSSSSNSLRGSYTISQQKSDSHSVLVRPLQFTGKHYQIDRNANKKSPKRLQAKGSQKTEEEMKYLQRHKGKTIARPKSSKKLT